MPKNPEKNIQTHEQKSGEDQKQLLFRLILRLQVILQSFSQEKHSTSEEKKAFSTLDFYKKLLCYTLLVNLGFSAAAVAIGSLSDETEIDYAFWPSRNGLYQANLDYSRNFELLQHLEIPDGYIFSDVHWTYGGSLLYILTDDPLVGLGSLWMREGRTGETRQLLDGDFFLNFISPDGRYAYIVAHNAEQEHQIIDIQHPEEPLFESQEPIQIDYSGWNSPDYFIYALNNHPENQNLNELYVFDIQTRTSRLIYSFDTLNEWVIDSAYDRDRNTLYTIVQNQDAQNGSQSLYARNLQTGEQRELFSAPQVAIALSPDANALIYYAYRGDVGSDINLLDIHSGQVSVVGKALEAYFMLDTEDVVDATARQRVVLFTTDEQWVPHFDVVEVGG